MRFGCYFPTFPTILSTNTVYACASDHAIVLLENPQLVLRMLLSSVQSRATQSHMKVNPNHEVPITGPRSSKATPPARSSDTGTPNFVATNKLAQKLASTPDVRADEVARAKTLIADADYPDDKTIRSVAQQIADTIHPPLDADSQG